MVIDKQAVYNEQEEAQFVHPTHSAIRVWSENSEYWAQQNRKNVICPYC